MNTVIRNGTIDRRVFLKVSLMTSGALLVGVGCNNSTQAARRDDGTWAPNLYVRIDPDGAITIVSSRVLTSQPPTNAQGTSPRCMDWIPAAMA